MPGGGGLLLQKRTIAVFAIGPKNRKNVYFGTERHTKSTHLPYLLNHCFDNITLKYWNYLNVTFSAKLVNHDDNDLKVLFSQEDLHFGVFA